MSAGVSRSSASEGSASTANGTPASRAAATWRSRLPGPKAGRIASGGESTRALVPVPWRSGTTATYRSGTAVKSPSSSRGSSSGQSPGRRTTHRASLLERPGDPQQGRLGVALIRGIGDQLGAGGLGEGDRHRLTADHDRPLHGPRACDRLQGVLEHGGDQRLPSLVLDPRSQPLLGGAEPLHRDDRRRAQSSTSPWPKSSTSRASPPRASGPAIRVGRALVGISAGGGSGSPSSTIMPSIRPS